MNIAGLSLNHYRRLWAAPVFLFPFLFAAQAMAESNTGLPVKVVNAIIAAERGPFRYKATREVDAVSYTVTFAKAKLKTEGLSVYYKEGREVYIISDVNLDGTPDGIGQIARNKNLKIIYFPTMTKDDQARFQAIYDKVLPAFLR